MKPAVKWFLLGVGTTLSIIVLLAIFLAYQHPALLLDWTNISYCG
jgi:hypothetical protein